MKSLDAHKLKAYKDEDRKLLAELRRVKEPKDRRERATLKNNIASAVRRPREWKLEDYRFSLKLDKAMPRRREASPGGSYVAGKSCPKMGKEHVFYDKGTYLKCSVCGSCKHKPAANNARRKVERL